MISDERIERAARAADKAFDQVGIYIAWELRDAIVLAVLTADAPEIAVAEIRGLEMAKKTLLPFAKAASLVEEDEPQDKTLFSSSARHAIRLGDVTKAKGAYDSILARIAELKAKTEPTK